MAQEAPQLFTDVQNRILSSIPRLTGALSVCGSALIMFVMFRERRKLLRNSYDRLVLGLSFFDALSSLAYVVFVPWAIPADVPYVVGARAASTVPCDIAGWVAQMSAGSVLYTACLMVYFVLLVKLEWQPSRIARRVEPAMHLAAVTVALGTATVATARGFMNPMDVMPGLCWLTAYPPGCDFPHSTTACIRGHGAQGFLRGLAVLPFSTLLIVAVTMVLLIIKVRSTEQRLVRYRVGERTESQRNLFERTRKTAQRGLTYIAAFAVSFVPPIVVLIVFSKHFPASNPRLVFSLSLLIVVALPLQGFFNAFIYLRPQWTELTRPGQPLEYLARLLSSILSSCCRQRSSSLPPLDNHAKITHTMQEEEQAEHNRVVERSPHDTTTMRRACECLAEKEHDDLFHNEDGNSKNANHDAAVDGTTIVAVGNHTTGSIKVGIARLATAKEPQPFPMNEVEGNMQQELFQQEDESYDGNGDDETTNAMAILDQEQDPVNPHESEKAGSFTFADIPTTSTEQQANASIVAHSVS